MIFIKLFWAERQFSAIFESSQDTKNFIKIICFFEHYFNKTGIISTWRIYIDKSRR